MVRQTKSTKTTETEQVAAPVPTSVDVAPKEKKVKVAKAPKAEAAPVVADSSAAPEEVAPVASDNEAPLAEQSVEFAAKLQQMSVGISSLKSEFRALEKKWARELKAAQKQSSKRKRKAGNRAPSGFVKPTRISDELAKFLEKPSGTEMARTEVTRDVNKYIRTNNLQDKENGRKINPDSKLAALLKLKKTDELTYFNLQKYMSHHFAKATKEVVATA
jgi:chromatin remodeling complex protein RSC6